MDNDFNWIEGLMKEWFEVTVRGRLGQDAGDDKESSVLGRIVNWREGGIEYQADPRHRNIVLEQFGFEEGSKGLMVSGRVEDSERGEVVKCRGVVRGR